MSQAKKLKSKNKKTQQKNFWTQKNIIIIVIVLLAITASYFLFFRKITNEPKFVKEGEVTFLNKDTRQQLAKIDIEAAINPTERSQGLMFRSQMDEDNGMIFIFDHMDMQSFWMKNTLIPLDILFIDNKGIINTIHSNTIPYSEKSLPSKQKSQFVVEVNGGFCFRHNIHEGDLIEYKLDAN
jgi:uncharacterized membrane protein (UPF0127 family)